MRRKFFWSLMAAAALALVVGGIVAAAGTNRQARTEAIDELSRQAEAIGRQAGGKGHAMLFSDTDIVVARRKATLKFH